MSKREKYFSVVESLEYAVKKLRTVLDIEDKDIIENEDIIKLVDIWQRLNDLASKYERLGLSERRKGIFIGIDNPNDLKPLEK